MFPRAAMSTHLVHHLIPLNRTGIEIHLPDTLATVATQSGEFLANFGVN